MSATSTPQHHLVVESANWSEVLRVRQQGAAWDSLRTRTGLPALGVAILSDSPMAVQTLLENGAPVDPQMLFSGQTWSAVWAALTQENADILDLVLRAGASPDEPHPITGMSPIDAVAEAGHAAATIVLCNRGARPNTQHTPSALWRWINHLTPYQDEQGIWLFPDARPVMALLNAGARVEPHKSHRMGVDPLEMARRKWLGKPLPERDRQHMKLALAALERAALMEQAESKPAKDNAPTRM